MNKYIGREQVLLESRYYFVSVKSDLTRLAVHTGVIVGVRKELCPVLCITWHEMIALEMVVDIAEKLRVAVDIQGRDLSIEISSFSSLFDFQKLLSEMM